MKAIVIALPLLLSFTFDKSRVSTFDWRNSSDWRVIVDDGYEVLTIDNLYTENDGPEIIILDYSDLDYMGITVYDLHKPKTENRDACDCQYPH